MALFLDFDGTLADLAAHPAIAFLPPETRASLKRLAGCDNVAICIVSGRDRGSLTKLVATPGVRCLGLYGWDAGGRVPLDAKTRAALAGTRREAAQSLLPLAGVWLEDKRHSFTIHTRGATAETALRARALVREAIQPHRGLLRAIRAKQACEVVPVSIPGKGQAVLRELARMPGAVPIYAGDDATDEDAFRALPRGITIHVGKRPRSHARYCLRDPDEVREFLDRLYAALKKPAIKAGPEITPLLRA